MGEAARLPLARESSSRRAPKFEMTIPPPDLRTPLRLPRNAVGRAVDVYWAGDARWSAPPRSMAGRLDFGGAFVAV